MNCLRDRADDETMIAHGERGKTGGRVGLGPAVGELDWGIRHSFVILCLRGGKGNSTGLAI